MILIPTYSAICPRWFLLQIELRHFNINEIKVWSQLKHSNIVQFMGALREDNRIVMLTEYVVGTYPGGRTIENMALLVIVQ